MNPSMGDTMGEEETMPTGDETSSEEEAPAEEATEEETL